MTTKICSLCNKPLSRYGNIKLCDGFLCRNCASIKSQWLTPDICEKMSVKQMINHFNYRKDNLNKIKDFIEDEKIEGKYTLYINKEDKTFVISKRKDYKGDNADILDAKDVSNISIYEEEYANNLVNIIMEIKLNNPNISLVSFRVNEFNAIEIGSDVYSQTLDEATKYFNALLSICDHLRRKE